VTSKGALGTKVQEITSEPSKAYPLKLPVKHFKRYFKYRS